MDKIAVLLMAYGTPNSLDEVEAYYTDIRGGRKPSPELVQELKARYERVNKRTPLTEITLAQAQALERTLGDRFSVYVGMKHWHPYIAETIQQIVRAGHACLLALALAPHYSRFSMDGYMQRVRGAMEQTGAKFEVAFVESWNDHPLYIQSIAERMEQMLGNFGVSAWDDVQVIFSAH